MRVVFAFEGLLSQNSNTSRPCFTEAKGKLSHPQSNEITRLQYLRGRWDSQRMYSTFYCFNGFYIDCRVVFLSFCVCLSFYHLTLLYT